MVCDLRGDQVEAEEEGQRKGEDCRAAEQRVDADGESDGERPGEAARGGSDAEEVEDGGDDGSLNEAGRGLHSVRIAAESVGDCLGVFAVCGA